MDKSLVTVFVTSSLNPSIVGQVVTLTAQVVAVDPSLGIPTGTVDFTTGEQIPVGTATLNAAGIAQITVDFQFAGAVGMGAFYSGDAEFYPNSGGYTQQVNPASTTLTISTDTPTVPLLGTFDLSYNFTTIPPYEPFPTGASSLFAGAIQLFPPTAPVIFYYSYNGGPWTFWANAPAISGGFTISYTAAAPFTQPGVVEWYAVFTGDDSFLPSVSNTITITLV